MDIPEGCFASKGQPRGPVCMCVRTEVHVRFRCEVKKITSVTLDRGSGKIILVGVLSQSIPSC